MKRDVRPLSAAAELLAAAWDPPAPPIFRNAPPRAMTVRPVVEAAEAGPVAPTDDESPVYDPGPPRLLRP